MNDFLARVRQHWRLYILVVTLMAALAALVHLLAGFSVAASLLVALVGFFANGILILLGEWLNRRGTGAGPQN